MIKLSFGSEDFFCLVEACVVDSVVVFVVVFLVSVVASDVVAWLVALERIVSVDVRCVVASVACSMEEGVEVSVVAGLESTRRSGQNGTG